MFVIRPRVAALSLVVMACLTAACTAPAAPASLDDVARASLATIDGRLTLPGLKRPVQIIRTSRASLTSTPRTTTTCSSRRAM